MPGYRNRGRGGRGGRGGFNELRPCREYQKSGTCKYGFNCKFSHTAGSNTQNGDRSTKPEETTEQHRARLNYNTWKRSIKYMPLTRDLHSSQRLWTDALEILNDNDREWKQMLPRDLDDDQYYGRQHIKSLLECTATTGQQDMFAKASAAFLRVFSHTAFLDCLSVDTWVGGLYNFIGGTNGTRAIPFFQQLCGTLIHIHVDDAITASLDFFENILVDISATLRELLRREQRVRFNDDLPDLINSLDNVGGIILTERTSFARQVISSRLKELRAMVSHAGELVDAKQLSQNFFIGIPSSYPRDMILPGDRHDNDKSDITKIGIFPTHNEILSEATEFLPSTDRDQPHFHADQVARHFDTLFRLLRYDTFGELREALANLMSSAQNDPEVLQHPRSALGDIRAHHYNNCQISYVTFNRQHGLEVHLSFLQPGLARRKSSSERQKWWAESRRLEEGCLLSLIAHDGAKMQHLFLTVLKKPFQFKQNENARHDESKASVIAKLVTHNQTVLEAMLQSSCNRVRGLLVEFPNVLPATFTPILENLQSMQRLNRLTFQQWILPDRTNSTTKEVFLDIPPPLYSRKPGFLFPLTAICLDGAQSMSIDPTSSVSDDLLLDSIENRTSLDRGQCAALVAALTREFAFIQGPPGTGKSYLGVQLMRVLLSIRDAAELGPVVVVCYTNHALDQFLEHLLEVGITKIIRMGGQSHSTLLEDHNLRTISKSETRTRTEGWQLAMSYEALEKDEKDINRRLGRLHSLKKKEVWKYLERHLAIHHQGIHNQFGTVDEDGFETVGQHPFEAWRNGDRHPDILELEAAKVAGDDITRIAQMAALNVHVLTQGERQKLVQHWLDEVRTATTDEIFELVKDAETTTRNRQNLHDEVDRRILQGAHVIGITTTGLAKRIATLQRLQCKIVICEEAGEVMEPHMVSALLPSVEHFIQIGDHEQLRPTINNFKKLSLESSQGALYQLDRSQFERLSVGERGRPKIPLAQLNVQRRMRPEISSLIRETIYSKLVDHATTKVLPDVIGMRRNVFWLDHENEEESKDIESHHDKSKSNSWEVAMVHSLVRHIVRQGVYKSDEIAVLTPYTGQLQKLRAAMRQDFEIVLSDRDEDALVKEGFVGNQPFSESDQTERTQDDNKRKPLQKKKLSDLLRVATVDNFQGEEAKIIIVSLVRSNRNRKVGFLRTTNRINVLLSRAQHGMFLIGNTDTYSNIPMWAKVIGMLKANGFVGTSFSLCCPRHPETETFAADPDDFAKYSPEGGCRLACDRRLPDCGHSCEARCHSQRMHEVFSCPKPCERLHQHCNHACQKDTCGEDCGNCLIKVNNVKLACGHFKDGVECYKTRAIDMIRCTVMVTRRLEDCQHMVDVQCFRDVTNAAFRCPTPCAELLPCGHACSGTCGRCNSKNEDGRTVTEHQACHKTCERPFGTCNHTCPRRCHDSKDCGPCLSPCEVRCAHSKCTLKCHEPCAPCVEPCAWNCEHQGNCTLPCSAPCNRLPCNDRCTKNLPCGHRCPGICGETCPVQYCHTCQTGGDACVDMLEFKTYAEIDVDDTPVVVLGCGHFFTAETLDGMMDMSEVYETDKLGQIIGLKDISREMASAIPKCPSCNLPVRQYATQRFNRVINRAVIDEMSKRFLVSGQQEMRALEQQLKEMEQTLVDSKSAFYQDQDTRSSIFERRPVPDISRKEKLQDRYKPAAKLSHAIKQFQREFADRHQPAQKLYEATLHSMRRNQSLEEAFASMDIRTHLAPVGRDRRIKLGGKMIQIQAECIVLEDKFQVLGKLRSEANDSLYGDISVKLAPPFLKSCKDFIGECKKEKLPKLAVEATLYYARIARAVQSSGSREPQELQQFEGVVDQARTLLEQANELCTRPFQNADRLKVAVDEAMKLLRREWYEEVTAEEINAIKEAMVSGYNGIATHSGHWYNCVNGHPFAIGECGMPMELAECPECGARIGGQHHTAVDGVSRAMNMER